MVTVDGETITDRTVPIDPGRPAELTVAVTNKGETPQKVRSVRLSGTALALRFFSYDTTVPFEVGGHETVTRTFTLDLADLDGQAIGLLPASVELLDTGRSTLGSADTVTDVQGSVWSVYGVFGIAVLVLTILAWGSALLALARHRLSPNRWRRALRFLPAGIGTGLIAVVTLSVLRLVPPEPVVEIPVILGAAAIALLLGYLTPHPVPEAAAPIGGRPDDATVGMTTRYLDPRTEQYTGDQRTAELRRPEPRAGGLSG